MVNYSHSIFILSNIYDVSLQIAPGFSFVTLTTRNIFFFQKIQQFNFSLYKNMTSRNVLKVLYNSVRDTACDVATF